MRYANGIRADQMLDHFKFAKFTFVIEATEEISLPIYKGAVFRGGFGYGFKRIVCVQHANKSCLECMLKNRCAYSYIFETPLPEDAKVLKLYKTVPHPFVIEPPLDNNRIVKKDTETAFNLILIGKAIDYLPYFVITFSELGKKGIGKNRSRFILKEVKSVNIDGQAQSIYNHEQMALKSSFSILNADSLGRMGNHNGNQQIKLEFLTPCRIRFNEKITGKIEFHILIRSLLRRVSSLSIFHCEKELELDFKQLIEDSKSVVLSEDSLQWHDWERYSTRQKRKMSLGGAVGSITYQGDFKPFLQLLQLGEYLHVGKGTSFGLGRYVIVD